MPRLVIAIALMLVTMQASRADPRAADRAVVEADARAQAKDFVGAAAKYREAYAADPRPDLICNVGVAYYKAQDLPRAQLYLSRCLERGSALDAKFIGVVRATLAKLDAALAAGNYAPVDIVVEPRFATVAIDAFAADETFDGGRTVWLAFGTYQLTVRARGYRDQTVSVEPRAHTVYPLRIALEPVPEVARTVEPTPPVSAPAIVTPAPPREAPRAAPRSFVPAAIATGATVGLAAFAVYARGVASDHADRAKQATNSDIYRDEADGVRRWNTIFGVDLAVTGVAALASGYLWYRFARAPAPAIAPGLEASGERASITLGGRF